MLSVRVKLEQSEDFAGHSTCQPYHWEQICQIVKDELLMHVDNTDWVMFEFDDFYQKYRTPMFPVYLIQGILFAQCDYWCGQVLNCLSVDSAIWIKMWHTCLAPS